MKIYVNYENKAWKKYKIDFNRIARAAATAAHADKSAQISITLTDDKHIHELNREYRNIDRPTNVLSFELGDSQLLGDIFISLDTVMREAAEQNISLHDHTAHMVVHGVLHLMGYDHINDVDAARMEALEIQILKSMNIENPYADAPKNAHNCLWRTIGEIALYALFGAVAAFGFAPFNIWIATLIGFGGAYWLTTRATKQDKFWTGYLRIMPFGAAYAVLMFFWMLNSIYVVPELAAQFAIWTVPALVGIGLAGALIFSLPFAVLRQVKTRAAARPIVFAGLWTTLLWLREWVLTGFPWNPIANITLPFPIIANSMSFWGALGLTFVIVGLIASVVELIRIRAKSSGVRATFVLFVVLLAAGCAVGYSNMLRSSDGADNARITIRVVQPAQSQSQKMAYSREDALRKAQDNMRNLLNLAFADGTPADLIVFPETTYPFIINDDEMPIGKMLKTNVVIGATSFQDGRLFNSLVVGDASGSAVNIYSKTHLVPFGEYSPLGIFPSPGNLSRGTGAELISIDANGVDFTFAPAVCYEIIFSDSLVPRGAAIEPNAIINITNDTWFGKTPGTYQHLDMVRRYAIESGLPVVRANYSGISAFVTPTGEISSFLPIGAVGVMDGTVWGAHRTPYRAIGRNGWMMIILLFASICAVLTVRRRD